MDNLAMLVRVYPGDEFISEPHARVGIDVQPAGRTPGGKGIGIDIDFLEGVTVTPELIRETLRGLEPLLVAGV